MIRHVQIHTLHDYAISLPNRGAEGLAKRAVYGGTERQRISSQCIKHALRSDNTMVRTEEDEIVLDTMTVLARKLGLGLSVRSALIGDRRLQPMLRDVGLSDEDAESWSDAVMAMWRKKAKAAGGEGSTDAGEEHAAPLVVGEQELQLFVNVVQALRSAQQEAKDLRELFEKPSKLRNTPPDVQDAVAVLKTVGAHAGLDGALFGRMATGVAVSNVDSAVHVSHALTVHPIVSVPDFFSVTDDLKEAAAGEAGGSHINTMELTTGLFYHYAVVDLRQLQFNLGELCTAEQRAHLLGWLIRALATVQPAAKKGSTAPYSGLRELMVEIGARQPRTLMGAYEVPVRVPSNESLSEAARDRLVAYAQEMDQIIGAPAQRFWLRDHVSTSSGSPAVEALADAVSSTFN